MQVIHRCDLTDRYHKYTREERRLLEECLHLGDGSLFRLITVHSDSDWIHSYPEEPQQWYYSAIHLCVCCFPGSFGEAEAETGQYVRWLRDYCQAFYYRLVVKLLPPVTVAAVHATYRSTQVRETSSRHPGPGFLFVGGFSDAFGIVDITMIDLYPKDSWNFMFGQASLTEGN
uniref:Uncharacterized protein n=1 Tax=Hucho hucho TaxID=62062 RepID=A0A4W5PV36_9TELE